MQFGFINYKRTGIMGPEKTKENSIMRVREDEKEKGEQ